ncbi:potassium transporter Kup [Actinomadura verrucosospora]|uniref:Probable potassium transport system protein Kup n=1 Tax=Actinomadura verrucosospora TaxID=46165 RepID=A0A7D3ZZX5_ACTVE|nr:potassium transporter Kup [Actinomadura verrucosospora]QKG22364.1 low affinity potassium transporter (Kup family) [Actinomadura verrucosospora]
MAVPEKPPALEPGASTSERRGRAALMLGALGVVYGDIGTSPLYSLQTVFSIDHGAVHPTHQDVHGVISLVFWTITVIVSVKYVTFILRADNDGEGGVMALAALVRRVLGDVRGRAAVAMALGVLGASLFYGDSVITPAISVLSAVEGLKVSAPGLSHVVVPVAATILTLLFLVQRWGTHRVGSLFGPVMLLWFAALAVAGLVEVIERPAIVRSLSPTYAFAFAADRPYTAFIAMGAIVLVITGAEALYADMGHFGKGPIRRVWFGVVFPALTLNYLGQGALILDDPSNVKSPFFLLFPHWARLPMVVLATAATVIASQAVISGAFSVSRQAIRLGYLPRMRVRHTSPREIGQVYLPAINGILFVGVLVLMAGFRSSERLATAYGMAVTGTFLITTALFLVIARVAWRWAAWKLVLAGIVIGGAEVTYFSANLTKIMRGGWLPLLIAITVFTVMTTWERGREIVTAHRTVKEGPLPEFIEKLHRDGVRRVPGTAVFPHPTKTTTPIALRANYEHNHVVHEHVVIVSMVSENVPYVPAAERLSIDDLGYRDDGIVHVTVRHGFQDHQDLPAELHRAARLPDAELRFDPDHASYFLSRGVLRLTRAPGMRRWRKRLFLALARNAENPAEYFALPETRTVHMGSQIDV